MDKIKFFKPSPMQEAINELPCCGCGNPESVYQAIHTMLSYFDLKNKPQIPKSKEFDKIDIYENPFVLFMAYYLDNEEYLNHGTSIGYSWLTEKGETMLRYLKIMESFGYDLTRGPENILWIEGDAE